MNWDNTCNSHDFFIFKTWTRLEMVPSNQTFFSLIKIFFQKLNLYLLHPECMTASQSLRFVATIQCLLMLSKHFKTKWILFLHSATSALTFDKKQLTVNFDLQLMRQTLKTHSKPPAVLPQQTEEIFLEEDKIRRHLALINQYPSVQFLSDDERELFLYSMIPSS